MQTTADECALFREECLFWQREFGLTDWTLHFKSEPAAGRTFEAEVDYDCDSRHATVTYYVGVVDALHPSDVACHEVLHLLFADMLSMDDEDLLNREEHRVIERLLKLFPKLRRKR